MDVARDGEVGGEGRKEDVRGGGVGQGQEGEEGEGRIRLITRQACCLEDHRVEAGGGLGG